MMNWNTTNPTSVRAGYGFIDLGTSEADRRAKHLAARDEAIRNALASVAHPGPPGYG